MGRGHVKRLPDDATVNPVKPKRLPALLLFWLAACVPILENQIYQGSGPENITVRQVNSDSVFPNSATSVAIYRETGGHCVFDFIGTIKARSEAQRASLPVGERIIMKFNFMGKYVLSSNPDYNGISRMVTLRAGRVYDLQMSEERGGFDYTLFDTTIGTPHLVAMQSVQDCE
ncbi:MAG: hypothetical protein GQ535_14175 [Rhodobacteraceae bacterium]|nr:hypothetical protein [Paracoccaceae bacterium]